MELPVVLSLVSTLIALITVMTARKANACAQQQLALSTKEHLFELRMNLWIEAQTYMRLFKLNRIEIDRLALQAKSSTQQIDTDALYALATHLIETDTAEELNLLANKSSNHLSRASFLKALENLDRTIIAIPLVFEGNEAAQLTHFIVVYRSLLIEMYHQYLGNSRQSNAPNDNRIPYIESSQDFAGNNQFDEIASELQAAYQTIIDEGIEDLIINQIRLV